MVDPAEKTRFKALLDMMPVEDVDDAEANPAPGRTEEEPEMLEPEMKLAKKRRAPIQTPIGRVKKPLGE
jgi:hypothetical protein